MIFFKCLVPRSLSVGYCLNIIAFHFFKSLGMQVAWTILLLCACISAEEKLSLNSKNLDGTWKVKNQNGSISVNGRVPGGIFSDLVDNGVLNGSIFYRNNDQEFRWVAYDNWTYSTTFDIPQKILVKTAINLVFHGIDTVADVYLNNQLLGSVDNMFLRHIFPIKNLSQATDNFLEVRFKSPVLIAAARYKENPIQPNCVPNEYNGECHANMIRKMQASFAWDWGPAFPSVGIWKDVEIEGFNEAVIRDINVITLPVNGLEEEVWNLHVIVFADLAQSVFNGQKYINLAIPNSKKTVKISKMKEIVNKDFSYIVTGSFQLTGRDLKLWWPNGMGNQSLYGVSVALTSNDSTEIAENTIKAGVRTIELVQEPVLEGVEGLSYYFKVNNVSFFAKGSNWIPGHILPELGADPDEIRHLLQSAKETNMNMIRVWGGGVYESDQFYNIADELGILIWQDMMFACAMYPVDEASLNSAKQETEQQVRRLQHHPSIALWSGNNENEAALIGNWYNTASEFDKYKEEYISLYVNTIKKTASLTDSTRPFIVSSPSNGIKSEEDGYIASDPYSSLYGDVHYYNYISDGWNSFTFPDTRFASEYGFQGMSSYLAFKNVTEPDDRSLISQVIHRRQHHPLGYAELRLQIKKHLPLPIEDGSEEYFQTFIYYSQISQAMSTKTETEKYRRDRSKLTPDGKGFTMGALYWQLNDVWQAPTWASIEFGGRWKMLHYFARHFFAPILVSPEVTPANEVNVYLISDLLEDESNLTLTTHVHSYSHQTSLFSSSINVTMPNSASTLVSSTTVDELLKSAGCAANECFFHFTLSTPYAWLSENIYFPTSLANVTLPEATIEVEDVLLSSTDILLGIKSDNIAPFVWLETEVPGTFVDNGFTLISTTKRIVFRARGEYIDLDLFYSTLTIQALNSPRKLAIPTSLFQKYRVTVING